MAEDESIAAEYGGRKKPYSAFAEDTEAMAEQMQAKVKTTSLDLTKDAEALSKARNVSLAQNAAAKKKKLRKMGGGKLRPVDGIGAEGDEQ